MRSAASGLFIVPILVCGGCASPIPPGFQSPVPRAKVDAVLDAERRSDTSSIVELVEQIDSDDALVRMTAIHALEQVSGEPVHCRHDDPPAVRDAEVQRWLDRLEAGTETEEPVRR